MSTTNVIQPPLNLDWAATIVRVALDEDLGGYPGVDVTSSATHGDGVAGTADLMARESGVIAGLELLSLVTRQVAERFDQPEPTVTLHVADGARVRAGDKLATVV